MDHVSLVNLLNQQVARLNQIQHDIQQVRQAHPENQAVQLNCDRSQARLDRENELVNNWLFEIPRSN